MAMLTTETLRRVFEDLVVSVAMFEMNYAQTRNKVSSALKKYLGLTKDFYNINLYYVRCDELNNTALVVDQGQLLVDVILIFNYEHMPVKYTVTITDQAVTCDEVPLTAGPPNPNVYVPSKSTKYQLHGTVLVFDEPTEALIEMRDPNGNLVGTTTSDPVTGDYIVNTDYCGEVTVWAKKDGMHQQMPGTTAPLDE